MNDIGHIFTEHMDLVYIIYGLSFFMMGILLFALSKEATRHYIPHHLPWLATFAVSQGLLELIPGKTLHNSSFLLLILSVLLLITSLVALLEFSRRIYNQSTSGFIITAAPLYLALGGTTIGLALWTADPLVGLNLGLRYLFGVPAALVSGVAIIDYRNKTTNNLLNLSLLVAGISLICYAGLTFFLSSSPLLSEWLPTTSDFFTFTNVPVQVFRALCAMLMALSFVVLLRESNNQISQEIETSRNLLQTIVNNTPDGLWLIGEDGEYKFVNRNFCSHLGVSKELVLKSGHISGANNQAATAFHQPYLDCIEKGERHTAQVNLPSADGEQHTLEIITTPLMNANGTLASVVGISRDITELKQTEAALRRAFRVFSQAREGIMITDPSGDIVDVNAMFTEISGYSREDVIGKNPRLLQSGRQTPDFYKAMWESISDKGFWSGEVWNRRKNGEEYPEALSISSVWDDEGKIQNYVAMFGDITIMRENIRHLEHIANFDQLTGLPNRGLIADRMNQAMVRSLRHNTSLAVAFIDLDGFKAVNDTYSHETGDELLIALSVRMQGVLRKGDTLARIGGDEFVVLLDDLKHTVDCEPVLDRLLQAASDPVNLDDITLQVSASIGVTFYPQDKGDADQLTRHADHAMYAAKQSGKNRYSYFDVDHEQAVYMQGDELERFHQAFSRCEFVLYYQPKVNMKTGEVLGAEALIRWQHPQRGLLSPDTFLPIIENNPISVELGEWVIETALSQIGEWQLSGIYISVSVNISAFHLQHPEFATKLAALLAKHPTVKPTHLQLEILETSAIEDIARVSKVVTACRKLGVSFALDDFGTGYSSLTYLRHLKVDTLKIDQTFVRDMLDDSGDMAIVNGVVAMATAFNRHVIAEGVETVAHGMKLIEMGCDLGQGYGISRPMPAAEMPNWVSSWTQDEAWSLQPIRLTTLAA